MVGLLVEHYDALDPLGSDALDEAGPAHKDIEEVMRFQSDLVDPVVTLWPLGLVKG